MTHEVDPDLDFSNLEPIEIPIPYGSVTYYLREMSEDTHKWHRSSVMKASKEVNGETVFTNPDALADIPRQLIHRCLFTEPGGDAKKRVSLDTIGSMPTRAVGKLFDRLRKISGLDQEELTVAQLRSRIEELQKQLAIAEEKEAGGGIPPTL